MATVYHRTWAKNAISILFGEGFKDNKGGFIWVADVPIAPFTFGNVLSDVDSTAGGDCVIRIEINDAVLKECESLKKKGPTYIKVPAEKLNQYEKQIHATTYDGMTKEQILSRQEECEATMKSGKKDQWIGWHSVERWKSAVELHEKATSKQDAEAKDQDGAS